MSVDIPTKSLSLVPKDNGFDALHNMAVTTRSSSAKKSSPAKYHSSAQKETLSAQSYNKHGTMEKNTHVYMKAIRLAWNETEEHFNMICTQKV